MNRSRLLVLSLALSACSLQHFATDVTAGYARRSCVANSADSVTIAVTNLGWHTGIVVRTEDVLNAEPQLSSDLRHEYVEIGWGDKKFYQSSGYSWWRGFTALFFSQGAVLHLAGFSQNPSAFFETSEVIELQISKAGHRALIEHVLSMLRRSTSGKTVCLGKSLYGEGCFYDSTGDFSISNSCNSWTAEALKIAGCGIDPELTRASSLVKQLKQLPEQ